MWKHLRTCVRHATPLPTMTKAVSTPVPVAHRTLANGTIESGLRSHEIKIDRPRTVHGPFDDFAVSTLRPERVRYWPNYMLLISEWQADIISISNFFRLGDDLLAGLCFFLALLNTCMRYRTVPCHYGAYHYGACQYDASAMAHARLAQVQ